MCKMRQNMVMVNVFNKYRESWEYKKVKPKYYEVNLYTATQVQCLFY